MRCYTGISGPRRSRNNTREKIWHFFTRFDIACDCQQSQVSTRERFKIYLHYGWSWLLKGTNNYKLLPSRRKRKTQNNRGNKIGQGKSLTNVVWLASMKDGKTKRLLQWRNRYKHNALWYSNVQFFWETFTKEIKQSRIMRKIQIQNTNRREWKECENNKKNVRAKTQKCN